MRTLAPLSIRPMTWFDTPNLEISIVSSGINTFRNSKIQIAKRKIYR